MDDKMNLPGEWMDNVFRKFCKDHDISTLDLAITFFCMYDVLSYIGSNFSQEKDRREFFSKNKKVLLLTNSFIEIFESLKERIEKEVPDDRS